MSNKRQPKNKNASAGPSGSGLSGHQTRATPLQFSVPKKDGSVTVNGTEYLTTLSTGGAGAVSGDNLFRLSLALDHSDVVVDYKTLGDLLSGAGTRLSYLARAWSKFAVRKLKLHYQPIASTFVSGGVVCAFAADPQDYDQLDSADVGSLMSQGFNRASQISQPFTFDLSVDRGEHYFIEGPETTAAASQAYNRLASAGLVRVASQSALAANLALGALLLEYELELMVPAYLSGMGPDLLDNPLEVAIPAPTAPVANINLNPAASSFDAVSTVPAWFDVNTGLFTQSGIYQISLGMSFSQNYTVGITAAGVQEAGGALANFPPGWVPVTGSGTTVGVAQYSKASYGMLTFTRVVGDAMPGYFTFCGTAGGAPGATAVCQGGTHYTLVRLAPLPPALAARRRFSDLSVQAEDDIVLAWCVRFPALKSCGDWMYSAKIGAYEPGLSWETLDEAIASDLHSGRPTAQTLEPTPPPAAPSVFQAGHKQNGGR